MKRLKIGGVPEHFNLPWRLAIEEGKFKAAGIELHWSDMTGGTGQMIKGLQAGTLDIAVLLTEGITRAILKGLDAKIIAVYVKTPLIWGVHAPVNQGINQLDDLDASTFAISREGSGSHLMSYILAKQQGWDPTALSFNVVGDVYGGLWALNNDEAQGFLWEKYTTQPFVDQGKCKRIGEVLTPWPCFVIAVRNEVLQHEAALLQAILPIVQKRAQELKNSDDAAEVLAWRYALKKDEVTAWLSKTEWSDQLDVDQNDIQNVVETLHELNLVTDEEQTNWSEKVL
ncbi:MAG: substrate-binding domain-containing protein [Crocinitomicaceae bacterium]|jgi:ABC-type nitrate/sulfonate/bicarbonate transport system substrate-binding protein